MGSRALEETQASKTGGDVGSRAQSAERQMGPGALALPLAPIISEKKQASRVTIAAEVPLSQASDQKHRVINLVDKPVNGIVA